MASAYPAGLDTFATNKANATATTTDHPTHHNDLADAVNKIEAELGITPSGASATVAARFGALPGPSVTYLGATTDGSIDFLAPSTRYYRKITAASDGVLLSVGVYCKSVADNVPGMPSYALLTNVSSAPGLYIAQTGGKDADAVLLDSTSPVARWIDQPFGVFVTAGDYWIEYFLPDAQSIEIGREVGGGSGVSGTATASGTWLVEAGTASSTFSTNADEYLIRALFMAATLV